VAADGVVLRHLDDENPAADYAGMAALMSEVWGRDDVDPMIAQLAAERDSAPEKLVIHLAEADGVVVCAAWVRFHEGTDFASLWGGSTLDAWRRKGIYRALVARRAVEARDRGYRYLQVDASDDSLPILQRLGLEKVAVTTPYNWKPES
jgi:GNAT superfamily N-acetyltransferase